MPTLAETAEAIIDAIKIETGGRAPSHPFPRVGDPNNPGQYLLGKLGLARWRASQMAREYWPGSRVILEPGELAAVLDELAELAEEAPDRAGTYLRRFGINPQVLSKAEEQLLGSDN